MEYYRIQGVPHILANAAWGSDKPFQAIGGINGGEPDGHAFPMRYEVDYVRVYQKKK